MPYHSSILVIEDDPLYRTLYTARIGQILPYARIRSVTDGEEALDVLTYSRPELMILDLHMPRVDGRHLLERLKSDEGNDRMVILVISAFDEELSAIGSRGYPNVFAFNKPMRADEFELALRHSMDLVSVPPVVFPQAADSVIDHAHMRLYIGEDHRLHHAFAGQFVDNAKSWIHSLRKHLDRGDRTGLAECARNIWAAAAAIGAHDAAKLAHRLGSAAHERNLASALGLGEELVVALDTYCAALNGALASIRNARSSRGE